MNYQLVKNTEWKEVEINGEYKDIPSDWSIFKLSSLVKRSITKGTTPTTIGFSFLDKGDVKFFKVEHLKEDKILPTNIFINNQCNEKMKRSQLEENDLLFSIAGTIGNVAKVKKDDLPANINQAIAIIRFKNINDLDYTKFYIKNYVEKITKNTLTGVIPNFNLEMLENIEIRYPNKEQSTIASILSHQESIIQDIESLISKHESRFQYLSDELLSGRLRVKEVDGQTVLYKNPEDNWKEVEINGEIKEIPKDWGVFTLKDFGFVKTSSVDKKIKEGEQIVNLFNYMDVYRSTTKLVDSNIKFTKTSIKPHVLEENYIRKGDVFFTPSSETEDDIGYSATAIEDIPNAVYSYHLIRFRPTKKLLDERFSGKLFNTKLCRDYFTEKCNGLTRMTLKKGDFEELQIYFPTDLLEQNTIYSVIHNQEKMIEYQKSLWDKEKQKFNWLLDNLLSGKYLIKE